jgi:hypothetical protein
MSIEMQDLASLVEQWRALRDQEVAALENGDQSAGSLTTRRQKVRRALGHALLSAKESCAYQPQPLVSWYQSLGLSKREAGVLLSFAELDLSRRS